MNNVLDITKGTRKRETKKKHTITSKTVSIDSELLNCYTESVEKSQLNFDTLYDAYEAMRKSCDTAIKIAEDYKKAYLDAHQAWHRNADMADILIDVITMEGIEENVIPLVKAQLELEREHDFGEHDEDSYHELLHELNTRWDFLEEDVSQ